jgi:hypothetical protein
MAKVKNKLEFSTSSKKTIEKTITKKKKKSKKRKHSATTENENILDSPIFD